MSWVADQGMMASLLESAHNVTGSQFLTYFLLLAVFVMFGVVVLRMKFETTAIYVLPLLFALMAYSSNFRAVGGLIIIFLAVAFASYLYRSV